MEKKNKKSRKIEMKLVEDKNKRMVHLCKRREGLFKKVKSLHRLTGAEIAVIVFSVAGLPQTNDSPSFKATPSFEATLDRFLAQDPIPPPQTAQTLTQDFIFSSEPIDVRVEADMVKSYVERVEQSLRNSGDLDLDHLVALRREAEEVKQRALDRKRKREEDDDQLLRLLLEFA